MATNYQSILVVETGSGNAGSNAYITAAFMLDYFSQVGVDISSWGTPRIEQRIVLATRYMTAVYRNRWQGRRVSYQQSLDWPRYGVLLSLGDDVDLWFPGYGPGAATADSTFPENAVPDEVMAACAEFAYRADLNFDGGAGGGVGALMPDLQPGDASIVREGIGPLSVQYQAGRNPMPVYTYANGILRPYMRPSDMQTRLIRG